MNAVIRILACLALAAFPWLNGVQAQSYPSKPVHLVVNYPPGGPTDMIGRALANKLSTILGQPVVVDNRGGASGVIGTDHVAKSAPDGYTLLISPRGSLTVAPALTNLPYDLLKDLAPITRAVTAQSVLVVPPKTGMRNLAELVAHARANPGRISFASTGVGNITHLSGEILKRDAGIDIVHVPYRGAAPAVNDLVGGHADMLFVDIPVVLPHIESGKLIALAVASEKRSPALPEVPTTVEAGFPKVLGDNWNGLLAPSGTPKEIITKLNQSVSAALKMPDLRAQFARMGILPVGDSPEEFGALLRAEVAALGPLAKSLGVVWQ